jgi:flagellar hook-associated protein 1 FlgK
LGGNLLTGLQIARSGLLAQQAVIAVTAHNVANADDPNYSRQSVLLEPNPPYAPPSLDQESVPGQFGMGVQVVGVRRAADQFLDAQLWTAAGALGASTQQAQTLGQVQALVDEPSATGLGSQLAQFWNAWQNLANDPQSIAARAQVLAAGQALATAFQQLDGQLAALQANLDAAVAEQVDRVNRLAAQIATLNAEIAAATASGQSPNDLQDQRDALVGQLAEILPVQVRWQPDGEADVAVDGAGLVQGAQTLTLQAIPNPANNNFRSLSWAGLNLQATPSGGTLGALLDLRDRTVAGYRAQLDALAGGLAQQVNTLHTSGFDLTGAPGLPFFVPASGAAMTAGTIALNPALVGQPAEVAAASSPTSGPGDGSNALRIADLQGQAFLAGNTATAGDFYAAFVGQIGSDAAAAQAAQANLQALQQSIRQQQQQVAGVSLDEELTAMVEAQHAYGAAARTVAVIDRMLGDLVDMVQP